MRAARRASLPVVFYLLTSTATTYAACAWVLWNQSSSLLVQRSSAKESWSIVDAFETKAACDRAADFHATGRAKEAASEGLTVKRAGTRVFSADTADQIRTDQWYRCLPSGTDPRPRYRE